MKMTSSILKDHNPFKLSRTEIARLQLHVDYSNSLPPPITVRKISKIRDQPNPVAFDNMMRPEGTLTVLGEVVDDGDAALRLESPWNKPEISC